MRWRQQRRLCRWLRMKHSEYDQSGGSPEGAFCGTRAKPRRTSGGEAIRRGDNLRFRTGHHPQCRWDLGGVNTVRCFLRGPVRWPLYVAPNGCGWNLARRVWDSVVYVVCSFRMCVCDVSPAEARLAGADVGDGIWRRRVTSQAPCTVQQTAPRTKVPGGRPSGAGPLLSFPWKLMVT